MIEVMGGLAKRHEDSSISDWVVKLTLARRETNPITQQPCWREVDHTIVNRHGLDYGGKTLIGLQHELFLAIGEERALYTIVQRDGDSLTLDWQEQYGGKQFEVADNVALNAAGALMEEARLTLARCGLLGG